MKAGRIPKNQYLTEEKKEYRDNVWNQFYILNTKPVSELKCFILPSNNGIEISYALNMGILEENIFACDDSPALLATAKWRKDYPKVNILGSTLSRAIERLKEKNIKIDIVNLDLCTNLSQWMFDDVESFLWFLMNDDISFAITLMKGRESSSEATLAKMLFSNLNGSIDRIKIVYNFILKKLKLYGKLCFHSEYKSDKTMMCYGVFKLFKSKVVEREYLKIFEILHPKVKEALRLDNYFFEIRNRIAFTRHDEKKNYLERKVLIEQDENLLRWLLDEFSIYKNELYNEFYKIYDSIDLFNYNSYNSIFVGSTEAHFDYYHVQNMPYHRIH